MSNILKNCTYIYIYIYKTSLSCPHYTMKHNDKYEMNVNHNTHKTVIKLLTTWFHVAWMTVENTIPDPDIGSCARVTEQPFTHTALGHTGDSDKRSKINMGNSEQLACPNTHIHTHKHTHTHTVVLYLTLKHWTWK